MAYSYQDQLCCCYHLRNTTNQLLGPQSMEDYNSLESGNLNRLNLRIDLSGDEIFIPCLGRIIIEKEISKILSYPTVYKTQEVFINILSNSSHSRYYRSRDEYKSAGPLIKAFFTDVFNEEFLRTIKCGDTTYHGGLGTIFYENYEPIILMGLIVKKDIETPRITVVKEAAYVNPKIYQLDDPMSKHIKTKLIPELIKLQGAFEHSLVWPYFNKLTDYFTIYTDNILNYNFKVIIDDSINDLFVTPTIPNIESTSEDINNFLEEQGASVVDSIIWP